MDNLIEVSSLRIDYDETTAVNGLSLTIKAGEIYGFVGPNGAGKTSTIKALGGIHEPTLGTIRLAGFDLETQRDKALAQVGYMPDFALVYENLMVLLAWWVLIPWMVMLLNLTSLQENFLKAMSPFFGMGTALELIKKKKVVS